MKILAFIALKMIIISSAYASGDQPKRPLLVYDYKPLMYLSGKEPTGIFVDFFEIIAKEMDLQIETDFLPAARAIYQTSKDENNILLSTRLIQTDEMKKKFIFIKILEFKATLNGYKKDVVKMKSLKDLKGMTLVYFRGNNFSKEFAKVYEMTPLPVNSVDQEVQMVEKGRAAFHLCVVENCFIRVKSLSNQKLNNFDFESFEVARSYLEIMLKKTPKNRELAKKIEQAYRSDKVQKQFDEYFKSYASQYPTGITWKHLLKDTIIDEFN
ncbi:MAG: hypothetical protein CME71_08085 [Halobacteriovorax sp.]|nr:hypothetical protein [Halobacteriovorax sp.]|tara:strand:+ start:1285 stop:2091 length:807 start_codon:yes stop_codon:yes gene_type:complete